MKKTYELLLSDLDLEGVFAISLVSDPAMEEEFVLFNKEQYNLSKIEKNVITGLVLSPDK